MGTLHVFFGFLVVAGVKCWLLDLTSLTESEKVAIDELREEMGGASFSKLKEEYMEGDAYLSRWLSAKDFNVSLAKQLLEENLKWREEHRIDRILEEDWRGMEAEFLVEKDCVDLEGRPILYLNFGKWDIHKLMTEEDSLVRLGRYLTKLVEEMDVLVRKMRPTSGSKSVNQFNLIINFDGYDIWNQGCFQCLAFYKGFASTVQSHYPRSIERVLMVNVPARFEVIYWYIEADLMEKTRKSMHLFGEDRGQWEPAILEFVGRDQVPGKLLQQKPRDVVPADILGYFRPSDEITTRGKMTSGQNISFL